MKIGLTNNQLKMIAMVAMLLDHMGMILFPNMMVFRIVGRISFPVFAYMIGEAFLHTRSKGKYLLRMAALAAICQVGLYVATGSFYQSVLVSFSLSVSVLLSLDFFIKRRTVLTALVPGFTIAAVLFVVLFLPLLLPDTDFAVDYGLPGILIPVAVCYAPKRIWKLVLTAACMVVRGITYGGIQWFGLLAVVLLIFYNGKRGSKKLKYLFYIFYPLHLTVLYGIQYLLV